MKKTIFLSALTGLTLLGSFAQAAVILSVGPTASAYEASASSVSLSFTTQTANNSLLVIAYASRGAFASSVTFDGNTANSALVSSSGANSRYSQIWTLDLGNEVGTTSNITVNGISSGSGFVAYQLSNATLTGALTDTEQSTNPNTLNTQISGASIGSFAIESNFAATFPTYPGGFVGDTRTGYLGPFGNNGTSSFSSSYIENASGTIDMGFVGDGRPQPPWQFSPSSPSPPPWPWPPFLQEPPLSACANAAGPDPHPSPGECSRLIRHPDQLFFSPSFTTCFIHHLLSIKKSSTIRWTAKPSVGSVSEESKTKVPA